MCRDNVDTSYLSMLMQLDCMENTTSQFQEQQKPVVLFTNEERQKLNAIANDKFSIGAFSGMIFNAILAHPEHSIDSLIKLSLDVRSRVESLGIGYKHELNVVEEKLPSGRTITVNKFVKVSK